jgi:hypothetical protein
MTKALALVTSKTATVAPTPTPIPTVEATVAPIASPAPQTVTEWIATHKKIDLGILIVIAVIIYVIVRMGKKGGSTAPVEESKPEEPAEPETQTPPQDETPKEE